MSLPFVVQQTLRLMNPTTAASATTSAPSSPTPAAVPGASPEPNDPATPPAAAQDCAGGSGSGGDDGLSGGGDEAKAWGRLRDYEVEEAQTINHRLRTRRQQQQTLMAGSGDTFMPDGDLLFTDRYIQRFLEEEERTKRESADWTRNLDSSTARFRADAKERDLATTIHHPTTAHSVHDRVYADNDNDEAEGYGDVDYGDSGGDHGGASHHHHVGVRSGLSSVSRALGRKVKFSSSKIAASLGSRRIHRKDKGKEAATGRRHHGYYADADYYAPTAQPQNPLYDVADAGLLPAYGHGLAELGVVPSGTAAGEVERLFPLFNPVLAPATAAGAASSSTTTTTSDFEKTWGRDYSPFSTYAFDQRPAAQPQQEAMNVFDSDDEGDGDLPALEDLNP